MGHNLVTMSFNTLFHRINLKKGKEKSAFEPSDPSGRNLSGFQLGILI